MDCARRPRRAAPQRFNPTAPAMTTPRKLAMLAVLALGLAGPQYGEPVNPDATREARNLLAFLVDIQGRYILTGQHNFDASGSKYTNIVQAITGKSPILWGSDFSFAYKGRRAAEVPALWPHQPHEPRRAPLLHRRGASAGPAEDGRDRHTRAQGRPHHHAHVARPAPGLRRHLRRGPDLGDEQPADREGAGGADDRRDPEEPGLETAGRRDRRLPGRAAGRGRARPVAALP
jgi:hypothetical protein